MLCTNCLNSTDGTCYIHLPKIQTNEWVSTTTATCTERKYTKDEVLVEILYNSRRLIELKWYQFDDRKYYKQELKCWFATLDKFKS